MTLYLIALPLLAALMLLYMKIATHFQLVDKPNERSSHHKPTILGGGVVFVAAALLWFLYFRFQHFNLVGTFLVIAVVSFMDDRHSLPHNWRMLIHLLCALISFWQLGVFALPWWLIILAFILFIGWINAFNFMDGINGITAFYSAVSLGSLLWVYQYLEISGAYLTELMVLLLISVVVFAFFNARKHALVFAGDVGSISMAFLLGWFMLNLILETRQMAFILFFVVYGIDSTCTILYRLKRRENIFYAHRSHLYQYLSNEIKLSHLLVAGLYAFLQLIINIIILYMFVHDALSPRFCIPLLLSLSVLYLIIRYQLCCRIQKEIQ